MEKIGEIRRKSGCGVDFGFLRLFNCRNPHATSEVFSPGQSHALVFGQRRGDLISSPSFHLAALRPMPLVRI